MGRKKNEYKPHQIEMNHPTATLIAYNKKGKAVTALFDSNDLERIERFKNWRAVWHTDFDCAYIESKDFKDGRAIRTSVAAAVLNCSTNAPIRHLNKNVLDNRRANLEIYNLLAQPNDYVEVEGGMAIILKDRYGRKVGEALIDPTDLDLVIHRGNVWFKKRRSNGQPYILNQNGRLLAHLLLNSDNGIVIYENKNPLDNRRKNIRMDETPIQA